jgi:hypothetical protein
MNANDALEYYNALLEMLSSKNATWVLDQVNEEVRFGKIEVGEFSLSKEKSFDNIFQRRLLDQGSEYRVRGKEKLFQIIPFTPQERLILLIKAIRRLVVDTSRIQEHVLAFAKREMKEAGIKSDINFYSDDGERETFSLAAAHAQLNQEDINRLEQLLQELEAEAENDSQS